MNPIHIHTQSLNQTNRMGDFLLVCLLIFLCVSGIAFASVFVIVSFGPPKQTGPLFCFSHAAISSVVMLVFGSVKIHALPSRLESSWIEALDGWRNWTEREVRFGRRPRPSSAARPSRSRRLFVVEIQNATRARAVRCFQISGRANRSPVPTQPER